MYMPADVGHSILPIENQPTIQENVIQSNKP